MTKHRIGVVAGLSRPTLIFFALFLGVGLVLIGCAGMSKEAGFNTVAKQIDERIGYQIQWNLGTTADEQVAQAIRELLGKPLSADAAVQIALLNNRRLQATYEELGIAQAAVVDAGLLSNPVFHGVGSFGLSEDEPAAEAKDDSTYTFEVEIDFLSIFYAPMRKSVAEAEFEAAKLRVTAAVMDLSLQTRMAFYRVQADGQMLEMFEQVVLATQAGYEFAGKLVEAGNVPELDLLLQKTLYEQSKLELAATEIAEASSRERLNALMGLWGQDTAWTVETRLPDIPAEAMALSDLEKQAIEKSIDLAIARGEMVAVGKQLGVENATKLVPELDVGTEIERDKGEWEAGPALGFSIPFFDRNQGRIAAARSQLRRRQQDYYALAVEIRTA
ncbi:MAG: TolC family protein, partial [Candidatus Poribacteria bacterium]|nr:TolC family protein [Candidatus Poribacteria bacterium]